MYRHHCKSAGHRGRHPLQLGPRFEAAEETPLAHHSKETPHSVKICHRTRVTSQEPQKRRNGCTAGTPVGRGNLCDADTSASRSQKRAQLLLLAILTNDGPDERPDNLCEAMKERPKSMAETAAMQTVRQSHGCTP